MKRIWISLATVAAVAVALPGQAQQFPDGAYLRVFGGAAGAFGDSDGSGPLTGAAVGTRASVASPWAAELEFSRRGGNDIEATGAMVNLMRDLAVTDDVRVYAGAGVGVVRVEESGDAETGPAAQLLLGTAVEIGGAAEFTLELRHMEAGDGPADDTVDASWSDVTAGIAFSF